MRRAELEALADGAGLQVMASESKFLIFLCCGPNAGPSKIERAREKGAFVFDDRAFAALIETGELPDEPSVEI